MVILIYTKRKHIERFLGMSGSLDAAIRHLLSTDLSRLHKGRNEIDGERAFVNRFDYQTMTPEEAIWEGHAKYADMHVLLSGRERIGVSHVETLKMVVQKPDEDFIGYEGGAMAVQALINGTVDAVIIDDLPAKEYVAANPNAGLTILEGTWVTEDYAIGVKKGNTAMLEALNQALKELKEDGTVQEIMDKYIKAD